MTESADPALDAVRADLSAEMYVLGAVLHSAGRVFDEMPGLLAEDFWQPKHEELFRLMHGMHAKGEPVEAASVFQRLTTAPIHGLAPIYLIDLQNACLTWRNVSWYANTVRQLARLRRLGQAGARLVELSSTTSLETVDEAIEQARAEVDVASADAGTSQLVDFGELLMQAIDRWESSDVDIMPTGLIDLDAMLAGGLRPGHLMVIGARPAVGKSVVATVIAHAAASRGVGVLFSSLEMSRHEVVDRIIADVASVDLGHLTKRTLTEDDWRRVSGAHRRSGDWPLRVDDRADVTVSQIRARARDVGRQPAGIGLAVVDYLQLVRPMDSRAPRQEQVASISRGLKLIAKELHIPVVALAQVNRGPTTRVDKRPLMSDLRESGSIEADADEIVLLHRDDQECPGEIEFIVEKNRHGRTGKVALAWAPHYARVASMAREAS